MDSLANYASDGDNSNSSDEMKSSDIPFQGQHGTNRRASDANYDPVQMDMSEESNNNNSSRESSSERANSPLATQSFRRESSRASLSSSDQRRIDHENHTNSKDEHKRGDRNERNRHTSDKDRRSSYDDKRQRDNNHKDNRESKRNRDDYRKPRDEDKRKSSFGSSKDEKNDDREKNDKDHHYREDRRDRNRDRTDRDRRRERDRERDRRHARDDRSKDRYREERSNYHKEKDRTRSRSRSRDRIPQFRMMSYREEKGRNKLAQLEKLGIELKPPEGDLATINMQNEQSYYNPLTTATQGKYAEQIQKRKLLWASKSKQDKGNSASTAVSTANTWVGTTFTHDQDGKVTAKFKRLMGIKGDLPTTTAVGAKPDILKKQEEMFSNMEQQYEVARATTHTQRGVGLGYASSGYQFPR